MIFKQLLLIVLLILIIRNDIQYYAENQTEIGNIAELYNFPEVVMKAVVKNISKSNQTKLKETKPYEIGNIADLYLFASPNVSKVYDDHTGSGNKTNEKSTNISQNIQRQLKDFNQTNIENLANLYFFSSTNSSHKHGNKTETHQDNKNTIITSSLANNSNLYNNHRNSHLNNESTIASMAELYYFSSPTVMGIYNCSYDNTIIINQNSALANGSYIYKNRTLIPPQLVGNYDYEILYNGSKRSLPTHTRACICHLKRCITLCSNSITQFYQDVINDEGNDDDFLSLFSIKMTLANKTVVTQNIAVDFEHIILDEFCIPFYTLSPEKDKKLGWTFFENGTLLRHSDRVILKKNEYCFELYQDYFFNETYYLINPLNCAKKREELKPIEKLNYWTQVFSIPFFLITIVAYCCLSELRNVHGKCFMSYLISVTLSYGLLSYINLSQTKFHPVPCLLMGYLNHYMQLSYYTWLGIVCYDTWRSFSDSSYKSAYCTYALYGYQLPFLMTLLAFVMQNSGIDDDWKPGITEYKCGLEVNKWAASVYLFGPCLIILIFCLISFISTSRIIKSNDRDVFKIKTTELKYESPIARYFLYLRLFLIMGLSWFLDVLSYLFNMFGMRSTSDIIDNINALQGLYIFVNFIGRKRVRHIITERISKWRKS
ncbi:G-protein coupled receptor Mth2-like [Calliphora vicina]|uniref:G-protein coupled receptor Mth2-like n=1 Tax=Calliphora vicina TaxID=7373 RepID=UPI00325B6CBF